MAIDTVLLCKDCVHSRISAFYKYGSYIFELSPPKSHFYKCAKTYKPGKDIINPVTGPAKKKAEIAYCDTERKHGECGPAAKNWVPKKKKDLFKMLTKEEHD